MRGVKGAGEPGTICAAHADTETEAQTAEVVADRRRVIVAALGACSAVVEFEFVCVCEWWASKLSAGGCERNA